jgi:hypothetical protein
MQSSIQTRRLFGLFLVPLFLLGTASVQELQAGGFTNWPTYGTLPVDCRPKASQYDALLDEMTWCHGALVERCMAAGLSTNDIAPLRGDTRRPHLDVQAFQQKIETLLNGADWVCTNEIGSDGTYNDWFARAAVETNWYVYDVATNPAHVCMGHHTITPGEIWTNNSGHTAVILYTPDIVPNGCSWTNPYSSLQWVYDVVTNVTTNYVLLAEDTRRGAWPEVWTWWHWEETYQDGANLRTNWVVLETGTNWYEAVVATNIATNKSYSNSCYVAEWVWTNEAQIVTNLLLQPVGDVARCVTNYPSTFPVESMAGLFHRHGLGIAFNVTCSAWGFVTGGDAAWTQRQFTNGTAAYGYAPQRLLAIPLAECRTALAALVNTRKGAVWRRPFRRNANNCYLKQGYLYCWWYPGIWDDVMDMAMADYWVERYVGDYEPYADIWKMIDGSGFYGTGLAIVLAYRKCANALAESIPVGYAHAASFYARAERSHDHRTGSYHQFSAQGTCLKQDRFVCWNTTMPTFSSNMLSTAYLGSINFPPTVPPNPVLDGRDFADTASGFRVNGLKALLKWDVPGGFHYRGSCAER